MISSSSRGSVTVTQRGWKSNYNSTKTSRRAVEMEKGCMNTLCKPDDGRKVTKRYQQQIRGLWQSQQIRLTSLESCPQVCLCEQSLEQFPSPGIWVHSGFWKTLSANGLPNNFQSWFIAGMDNSLLRTWSWLRTFGEYRILLAQIWTISWVTGSAINSLNELQFPRLSLAHSREGLVSFHYTGIFSFS